MPEDNYAIIYYPPLPRAMIEVVDPDNPDRVVDYGETGRVRLTTLTKEFFMPRFLERDEAEREPPCELYPWDGVRNVRPFSRLQAPSSKESTEYLIWSASGSFRRLSAIEQSERYECHSRSRWRSKSQPNFADCHGVSRSCSNRVNRHCKFGNRQLEIRNL